MLKSLTGGARCHLKVSCDSSQLNPVLTTLRDRLRPQSDHGRRLGEPLAYDHLSVPVSRGFYPQKDYVIPAGTEVLGCHW